MSGLEIATTERDIPRLLSKEANSGLRRRRMPLFASFDNRRGMSRSVVAISSPLMSGLQPGCGGPPAIPGSGPPR